MMPHPAAAELIARAEALLPMLRAQAQQCEDLRRVPDETMSAMREAGFLKILQPAEFGGYELHPLDLYKVARILARGCPSTSWVTNLLAIHNWEVGLLDPRVAKTVWADNNNVALSSSYAPFGKVDVVEGGFRVSGRWPWSSGCDHATWAILGGIVRDASGQSDPRAFLIPICDYEIDDTWHVIGLKGTGSKDIVVKDAFVPEWRTHRYADSFMGTDPGTAHFTNPIYRYPFGVIFAYCLAAGTIGMAEGAIEEFRAQMAERVGAYDGAKAIEDPFVQHRLAEADALVRGVVQRLEANFAEMDRFIDAGEPIPLAVRVRNKWDAQVIAKQSKDAVDLLFKACGGRAIRQENPMQRYFRDIHAASNHAFLNADKGSLNAGLFELSGVTRDLTL